MELTVAHLALEGTTVAVEPLPQHATQLRASSLQQVTQFARPSLMDSRCLLVPILTRSRLQPVYLESTKLLLEDNAKLAQ